jgi:hypothetical protein
MPRVIISSGHTNANPGTVAGDLREVDLARKIARSILPYLRQNGIIALSVPPDMELNQRIEWINKTGYLESNNDVTVEIHINDGGKSGIEGWFEGKGGNSSQKLALGIVDAVATETKLPSLGARSEYDHELGSLAFLHECNPITALIECGFIDNENDAKFLRDQPSIELMGKGIAKGILKFLGLEYKDASAVQPVIQSATAPVMMPVPQPQMLMPAPVAQAPRNSFGDDFMDGGDDFGFGGGFGNSMVPPAPGGRTGFNAMPSRDERKEIIKRNYIKLLGREPNQNDLNYFLNIGITEDQLMKKIVDSQEHADLVKARQEVIKTKKLYSDQQSDLQRLRTETQDQGKIVMNLQSSIDQKNMALSEMQRRLDIFQKIQSERGFDVSPEQSTVKYKGSFLDRLFRAFSDLFD